MQKYHFKNCPNCVTWILKVKITSFDYEVQFMGEHLYPVHSIPCNCEKASRNATYYCWLSYMVPWGMCRMIILVRGVKRHVTRDFLILTKSPQSVWQFDNFIMKIEKVQFECCFVWNILAHMSENIQTCNDLWYSSNYFVPNYTAIFF